MQTAHVLCTVAVKIVASCSCPSEHQGQEKNGSHYQKYLGKLYLIGILLKIWTNNPLPYFPQYTKISFYIPLQGDF